MIRSASTSGSKIRIRIRFFQRKDPDPHKNDQDPQHWLKIVMTSAEEGGELKKKVKHFFNFGMEWKRLLPDFCLKNAKSKKTNSP
jgi:hypothetical protein